MKCINCNKEINSNSKYCEYCGYKINTFNVNNYDSNLNNDNNYMNNNLNQNNYDRHINISTLNQNINNDFKTWDGALNLFRSVKCIGRENCIFLAFINVLGSIFYSFVAVQYGIAGGIGGYDGLLINQTEMGIGIIPLAQKGVQTTLNADKLYPLFDRFIFIPNQLIEGIEIKNYNMFNKGMQQVNIALTDGSVLLFLARLKEKNVIYQEREFGKFVSRYKNK